MSFDLDIPKTQAIALLGLAVRDTSGLPTYSTALGDNTYATEEIDRAAQDGVTDIMRAICETDGHGDRYLFTASTALTHGEALPAHIGSIGVPRITPFSGATFTIVGKRASIEEISAWRQNLNDRYSLTAHDQSNNGAQSKLAGKYAIDAAPKVIYFTGFSAEADITNFAEEDYELLPDRFYSLTAQLLIAHLRKDGDVSDIFSDNVQMGTAGLAMIRGQQIDQPSIKKTIGTKDVGTK
jgi:hypothetical protein